MDGRAHILGFHYLRGMFKMKWLGSILFTLIMVGLVQPAQAHHADFVKIGTLWDVQSVEFSPQGDLLITSNANGRSFINLANFETVFQISGEGWYDFSPSGRYISFGRYYAIGVDLSTVGFTIYDRQNHSYHEFSGSRPYFSPDERYFVTSIRQENSPDIFRVWSSEMHVVGEYEGDFDTFDRSGRFIVAHTVETLVDSTSLIHTNIIDFVSNETVASFEDLNTGEGWNWANAAFSRNNAFLAIYYYYRNKSRLIDTTTWEILYEFNGTTWFSADSRLIATATTDDYYGKSELIDAQTGEVIDRLLGYIAFTRNGRYIYRNSAITYDLRDRQVIDLDSGEVIYSHSGYFEGINILNDLNLAELQHFALIGRTDYIDLDTGRTVLSLDGVSEYQYGHLLMNDWRNRTMRLMDWETLDTLAIARSGNMQFSPDGKFVFVSNGLFVDVYADPSLHIDSMPAPSPDSGIGYVDAGTFVTYTRPLREQLIEEHMLNDTYMNVLGRHAERDYLYVTYIHPGTSNDPTRQITGWIPANQVHEYDSWRDVPVLGELNPLGDLQRIAETGYQG